MKPHTRQPIRLVDGPGSGEIVEYFGQDVIEWSYLVGGQEIFDCAYPMPTSTIGSHEVCQYVLELWVKKWTYDEAKDAGLVFLTGSVKYHYWIYKYKGMQ